MAWVVFSLIERADEKFFAFLGYGEEQDILFAPVVIPKLDQRFSFSAWKGLQCHTARGVFSHCTWTHGMFCSPKHGPLVK